MWYSGLVNFRTLQTWRAQNTARKKGGDIKLKLYCVSHYYLLMVCSFKFSNNTFSIVVAGFRQRQT